MASIRVRLGSEVGENERKGCMVEYRRYLCSACGYIYDESLGDPDSGIAPGTRFEDIPEDWVCPQCGVDKSFFDLLD